MNIEFYTKLSDAELVRLLIERDDLAFTEIYNRYSIPVYYQVNQILRDQEAAKDVVQELFVSLWSNAANLRKDVNLGGYLYVAARNRIFKLIQKGKVRNDYLNSIAKYANELSNATLDELDEKELIVVIEREIAKLPPKMKEVFELSRKQNLSHLEIAAQMGISDKTVKKQINKALKILRVKLDDYTPVGILILTLFRRP